MAGTAAHHRAEKDAGPKAIIGFANLAARFAAMLLVTALTCAGIGSAVETVAQLQDRFDRENDGVRKAKLLQKLGDAQFDQERQAAKSDDYVTVGLVMEKYRDNVRAALEALKKSHPEAEKHSSGFKQLEIHVGKGLVEIRDVIIAVPEPLRPPMELVQKDLQDIDVQLLRLLFPRRPGEQPAKPSGASTAKKPAAPTEKQP
jgi:hypothetical protein